ncbi:MAG: hypothetical protein CMH54_07715 [Myxococcales bacterium]|nr:hypothetical protein [Myxococcales bacterium]
MDNDANGRVRLALDFYSADETKLGNTVYSSTYSEDSADWVHYSHNATAPEGTAFVRGFIRMYDVSSFGDADSATVNIDDWATGETPADPCDANPCANGTCVPDGETATCDCTDTGYEGETCETDIDECATGTDTCTAEETCENTAGGFTCSSNTVVGYAADVQPILQASCTGCHTTAGNGGHNVAAEYSEAMKLSNHPSCTDMTVGECSLVRVIDGSMPIGGSVSANDIAILQAWVDGGMQP